MDQTILENTIVEEIINEKILDISKSQIRQYIKNIAFRRKQEKAKVGKYHYKHRKGANTYKNKL